MAQNRIAKIKTFASLVVCISTCDFVEHSSALRCYSETDNMISNINCTATLFYYENCSENFLSKHYGDLYNQQYWPAKPSDMQVIPTNEKWYTYLLPGFLISSTPPRSGSIQMVRGFQIDFEEVGDRRGSKCVIIQIINRTLDFQDRDDNTRFTFQLTRLKGNTSFRFKSWSLPKPPDKEKDEHQIRYGRTGTYAWALTNAPSDWLTTISYHNNTKDNYIQVWFLSAPVEYRFSQYNVKLERIWSGEGTNQEHRNISEWNRIAKTSYSFLNVQPGHYRVLVQPFDDKRDSLSDCRCKQAGGGCGSCLATKTAVIIIGQDQSIGQESNQAGITEITYVLPSILGFIMVVLTVLMGAVGLCMFKRKRGIETEETIESTVELSTLRQPLTETKHGPTIAIISTIDDTKHKRIVDTFATFLREVCNLSILYQPCGYHRNKEDWISNVINQADYVIIAISYSAVVQYESWIENRYGETTTIFIEYLKSALDKSVNIPDFGDKIVIVKFAHSYTIPIPYDLSNKRVFFLTAELSSFLSYIIHPQLTCHSDVENSILKEEDIVNYRDGRNLLAAIDGVWQSHGRFPSGDSGYVDMAESFVFIPPSPTPSYSSLADSLQLHDQIYDFYLK